MPSGVHKQLHVEAQLHGRGHQLAQCERAQWWHSASATVARPEARHPQHLRGLLSDTTHP